MFDLKLSPGTTKLVADQMPQDWRASRLQDFCTFTQGGRLGLTKQDNFQNAGVPAYSAAGQDGFVDRVEFHDTRAVVLSAIGANCGRCFYAEGNWTTLANVQVIIPNPNEVDARFLFYRVNRDDYWPRSGSAQPFVKPSDIKSCWVALPELVEQNSIARVLDTLDTTIRQTEAIIAKLKLVKQGLLHDLLTRGIDANGELRPPQSEVPHLYKASPLGWIPREWEVVKLSAMTAPDSPITYGVVKPGPEVDGGIAFIRGGDIFGGRILVEQLRTIGADVSREYRRTLLRGGELLMSLVGYPGEVAVVPPSLAGANIARQAALIRLQQHTNASYVMNYLSSAGGKMQVLASSLGSAQQVVNLSDLRSVCVPLPTPAEQEEICVRLAATDAHLAREAEALEKLRSLKSGLMDDLLTGRVRVTPLLEPQAT